MWRGAYQSGDGALQPDHVRAAAQSGYRSVSLYPAKKQTARPSVLPPSAQCLQSGDWDTLETLLPKTSLDYFRSPEAEPVLARIRNAGNVVHY